MSRRAGAAAPHPGGGAAAPAPQAWCHHWRVVSATRPLRGASASRHFVSAARHCVTPPPRPRRRRGARAPPRHSPAPGALPLDPKAGARLRRGRHRCMPATGVGEVRSPLRARCPAAGIPLSGAGAGTTGNARSRRRGACSAGASRGRASALGVSKGGEAPFGGGVGASAPTEAPTAQGGTALGQRPSPPGRGGGVTQWREALAPRLGDADESLRRALCGPGRDD
jgi:hypothetical protein